MYLARTNLFSIFRSTVSRAVLNNIQDVSQNTSSSDDLFVGKDEERDSKGNLTVERRFEKGKVKYIKDYTSGHEYYYDVENDRPLYTVKRNKDGKVEHVWFYKVGGNDENDHYIATNANSVIANVNTLEKFKILNGFIERGEIKYSQTDLARIKKHKEYLEKIDAKIKEIKEKFDVTVITDPGGSNDEYTKKLLSTSKIFENLIKLENILTNTHPIELLKGRNMHIRLYESIDSKKYGNAVAGLGDISLALSGLNKMVFDHELTHFLDKPTRSSMDEELMAVYGGEEKYPGNKDYDWYHNKGGKNISRLPIGFPSSYAMINCTEHRAEIGEKLLDPNKIKTIVWLENSELRAKDETTLKLVEQLIAMYEQKTNGLMDRQYFKDLITHGSGKNWKVYFEEKRKKLQMASEPLKAAA